jgi:outer membrane protein OmpA-like peptidoglycan-associated protein
LLIIFIKFKIKQECMDMLKKTIITLFITFMMSLPAMAIEPPAGATIPWVGNNALYTSVEFNDVLEAYGLKLSAESAKMVPSSYAKLAGDTVRFNGTAYAYAPPDYHSILTAYGLEINPEEVSAKLKLISYASVRDGKVVFGNVSTAYNPYEWKTILSTYFLPVKMAAPAKAMAKAMPGDSDGDGVTDDKDACPNTPKGVKVDERGCWSHPAEMLFDFDKADVRQEYHSALDETKLVFDAYPDMKVQIAGYTCDIGSEQYNQNLSERRANAVRDYLVNKTGIDPNRLSVTGYGETRPAYPNDSEENRRKNRRVEFTPNM